MCPDKLTIRVGSRMIGDGKPVFIIAEAGVNHNGDLKLAKELIDAATLAGADAIKFQTYEPDHLVTKNLSRAEYQIKNMDTNESQGEMLERIKLKKEFHPILKKYAESKGLIFLSTPFSFTDADYLLKLGMPAIKVGSSDSDNIPYLEFIAEKKLPIILSTGMCNQKEVKESVAAIRKHGNNKIIVLQCTTDYPAPIEEANLRTIITFRNDLNLLTGFSDHTLGIEVAVAAVAIGAAVIEKHLTLDKKMAGPDHKASLEPLEFKVMIAAIRSIEIALGDGYKKPSSSEKSIARITRKSLVAARSIPAGRKITKNDMVIKRPGTGLRPKQFQEIIGRVAARNIKEDEVIKASDLS